MKFVSSDKYEVFILYILIWYILIGMAQKLTLWWPKFGHVIFPEN